LAHARASGAAHSSQNFAPASLWCWHREHLIGRNSPSHVELSTRVLKYDDVSY
jgi:hypothetical protein